VAKLTDFTTPTGVKGNLFDLAGLWSMILGALVFLVVLAFGQKLGAKVSSVAPIIDSTPDQLFDQKVTVVRDQKRVV
jgi:hypothetical protein